ncbi:MAG: ACP S-malonyltransferase [Gammaproteobacteria bacterium]
MNLALVFPGQGSQSKNMLSDFIGDTDFKEIISQASDILGYDIEKIVEDEEKINNTIYTQPVMLATSYAMWVLMKKYLNLKICIGAGHSLGEYSALVANDSISFKDGLSIVKKRAELMSNAMRGIDGAMAAIIGLSGNEVDEICKQLSNQDSIIEAVNFNCPGQTVIAGHSKAIDDATQKLKDAGAKIVKKLPVSLAAHTSLLRPVADELKDELNKININLTTSFDVIHNYDLSVSESIECRVNALAMQVCSPVRWIETLELFNKKNVTDIIEVGPGNVLSGLVKRFDKSINMHSINNIEDINILKQTL